MKSDYLQDALVKLNEALVKHQYGEPQDGDDTTIVLDVQAAMVIYEAAKTFHKEIIMRNSAEAAINAAQCRGSIARLPRIDRCACKVPELPVGFTKAVPGEKILCQRCKKILLTRSFK